MIFPPWVFSCDKWQWCFNVKPALQPWREASLAVRVLCALGWCAGPGPGVSLQEVYLYLTTALLRCNWQTINSMCWKCAVWLGLTCVYTMKPSPKPGDCIFPSAPKVPSFLPLPTPTVASHHWPAFCHYRFAFSRVFIHGAMGVHTLGLASFT